MCDIHFRERSLMSIISKYNLIAKIITSTKYIFKKSSTDKISHFYILNKKLLAIIIFFKPHNQLKNEKKY